MTAVHAEATLGHNRPPSPIDELAERADKFLAGADLWRERGAIADDEVASRARDFVAGAKQVAKKADELRKAEKEPHRRAAEAVDAAWRPVIDRAERAAQAVEPLLRDWLVAQERERKERERLAREQAAAELARAEEARRAAEQASSVRDQALAEERAAAAALRAKEAERDARAARDRTQIQSATGLAKAAGLRTRRFARVTDYGRLLLHYRAHPEIRATLEWLANADIRSAKGAHLIIPGVEIVTEQEIVA